MPSATPELRAKWGEPRFAEAHLKRRGYSVISGWITPPSVDHEENDDDFTAIMYLVFEWDYGYRGPKV